MKSRITFFLILAVALSFLVFPLAASAVDWLPLVPCGRSDQDNPATPEIEGACTRCDTFRLIDNVIHLVIEGIVPPVAAVLFITGGLMIVLAGARPQWIEIGKRIFWNTFIGLLIIYSSWLVVNTFMKSFAPDQAARPWYRLTCEPETGTVIPGGPPPGQINACAQCPAYPGGLTAGGQAIQCVGNYINANQPLNNASRTCPFADVLVAQNLVRLRQLNGSWVLSEGFPPTVTHAESCHGNGSCVDIVLSPRPSNTNQLVQQLNLLCGAARQAGFGTIINEYSSLIGVWPAGPTNCPAPRTTRLQTGDHLHISR